MLALHPLRSLVAALALSRRSKGQGGEDRAVETAASGRPGALEATARANDRQALADRASAEAGAHLRTEPRERGEGCLAKERPDDSRSCADLDLEAAGRELIRAGGNVSAAAKRAWRADAGSPSSRYARPELLDAALEAEERVVDEAEALCARR